MGIFSTIGLVRPNMTRIPGTWTFLVRSQAGFRKACRLYEGGEGKMDVNKYPTSYPALVSLSTGYRGDWYISVSWTHINNLKTALKEQGEI